MPLRQCPLGREVPLVHFESFESQGQHWRGREDHGALLLLPGLSRRPLEAFWSSRVRCRMETRAERAIPSFAVLLSTLDKLSPLLLNNLLPRTQHQSPLHCPFYNLASSPPSLHFSSPTLRFSSLNTLPCRALPPDHSRTSPPTRNT
jgi:hypothetical protein